MDYQKNKITSEDTEILTTRCTRKKTIYDCLFPTTSLKDLQIPVF